MRVAFYYSGVQLGTFCRARKAVTVLDRWEPGCIRSIHHDGPHEGPDPRGDLLSTVRWDE